MSKLDREITAIFEEAFGTAQEMVPIVMGWMAEEDMTSEELTKRTADYMKEHKPKTYEDYIHDLKRVFKEDGWVEPK